ncbi:MAG: GDSL-type esterase/lipase family protein [bacterium]|nr:GDSL-type esterase/lipase family protein [bacterium]
MKKMIIYVLIMFSIYIIYNVTYQKKINYVALGDELSLGVNPYNAIDYGYTDYLVSYFEQKKILGEYSNYSNRNYKIDNILFDIDNNTKKDNTHNLKKELRESDLVTLSVGLNDIYGNYEPVNILVNYKDMITLKKKIINATKKMDELLKKIKKYAKGKIIVIGFYSPFNCESDEITDYINTEYEKICNNNEVDFIKLSDINNNKSSFLNNSKTIYPTTIGYKKICNEIINIIEK